MTALGKQIPTDCSKFTDFKLLQQALCTLHKIEMLLIHMLALQQWKTFCEGD